MNLIFCHEVSETNYATERLLSRHPSATHIRRSVRQSVSAAPVIEEDLLVLHLHQWNLSSKKAAEAVP